MQTRKALLASIPHTQIQQYTSIETDVVLPYIWGYQYKQAIELVANIEGKEVCSDTHYCNWHKQVKPKFIKYIENLTPEQLFHLWRKTAKYDCNINHESDVFEGDDEMAHAYLTRYVARYNNNIEILSMLNEYIATWDDATLAENIDSITHDTVSVSKLIHVAQMQLA